METSVKGGSISVFSNGKLIDFHIGDKSVSGSEDILPKISELLEKNKFLKSDVETIAVSNGPGSFTGIRIGIATALALQKSLNCNCYGVDLLLTMASACRIETGIEKIVTAVSHGRSKICWFDFKDGKNLEKNYFVSDTEVLFEYIDGAIENNNQILCYADADIYRTLIDKTEKKTPVKFDLKNAGQNLSLIIGNAVLIGNLILKKPKPLYLNE